jgi:hypothetical protein
MKKDVASTIIDQKVSDVFTLILLDNGILHMHVSGADYGVEEIKRMVAIAGKMTNFKAVPFFITLDEKANPNGEARAYWSLKESCPYALAEGSIIRSTAHKLLGNFYLRVNKPGRPTKLFTAEEEAFEWLEGFL